MGAGRAFIFQSGERVESVLRDVRITGGSVSGDGGGVLCVAYSCPTIENCVFELNSAGGNGGGLASVDSAPMIRDCIFKQNSASGSGGGISETIASAGVQGCTFWGNTAGLMGGGLYGAACGDPEISYCTFYANSAPTGGGICITTGSYAQIENCIMSFSTLGAGVSCAASASVWISCSDIFGNAGGDWVGCVGTQMPPVNNNVPGNPMFCGPASGDFTISSGSPCYDPTTCGLIGAWRVGCGSQVTTRWSAGTGNWSDNANWTGGEPASFYVAFVSNGGTAEITESGESCDELCVWDESGSGSAVVMSSGDLTSEGIVLSGVSSGTFTQSGGAVEIYGAGVYGYLEVGSHEGTGTYELSGTGRLSLGTALLGYDGATGTLELSGDAVLRADNIRVGFTSGTGALDISGGLLSAAAVSIGASGGNGAVTQSAGTCSVATCVRVGDGGTGSYSISGGALSTRDLWVGLGTAACSLSVSNASSEITVSNDLVLGNNSALNAVSGTEIRMTGAGGSFDNRRTDPVIVAGLANLTLVFEGGTGFGSLEVGGEDLGPLPEGLESNFALDALVLGGDDVGEVMLADVTDNQPAWSGSEAQYVQYLEVGPGSSLDLNGLNFYYMTASIDPGATIIPNGGTLTQIGATPVEGALFASVTEAGTAMLRWTVASLADIEGFDVLRATSHEGPFTKVNDEAIAPTSPCSYEDKSVWPETTFWYEVRARLAGGAQDALQGSPISVTTGGRLAATLHRPVPNPFSSTTTLRFDVPSHAGRVRLAIYNIAGRLVKTLAGDETERGRHSVEWNGTDEHGRRVSHGVYFARLEVGAELRRQKIVVVR
jgi:hypothetical protein